MGFYPLTQEIARALHARRSPPPPVVPTLEKEHLKQFANLVFRNPARREIAEGLLVLAIRLDVLGFGGPRDQMLLLAGCGLSAAAITDALERRHAVQAGAHQLMEKARSTKATPLERAISGVSGVPPRGTGVRSGPPTYQHTEKTKPDIGRPIKATEVTEVSAPPGRPDLRTGFRDPKPRR